MGQPVTSESLDSGYAYASVDTGPSHDDVRRVVTSYYAALSARDWVRFAEHFWPGADLTTVWIAPGGQEPSVVTISVPDFVAAAPRGPDSRAIFEERFDSTRTTVSGGLAQAWVYYSARFGEPEDLTEWNGIDAITLLRHRGEWRIVAIAYESVL